MPGKWCLIYSCSVSPGSGSREDREIALEATTEDAAVAEAKLKWAAVLAQVKGIEEVQKRWIRPPMATCRDTPSAPRLMRHLF